MWFWISVATVVVSIIVFVICSLFGLLKDNVVGMFAGGISGVVAAISGNAIWILGVIWLIMYFIKLAKA